MDFSVERSGFMEDWNRVGIASGADANWNRLFACGPLALECRFSSIRKPEKRFLKILKRFYVPSVHCAQKGKHACPVEGVQLVQDGESLAASETKFVKRVYQLSQIRWAVNGLWSKLQVAQVQQSLINVPLPARSNEISQGCFAGGDVEVALCSHLNELVCADDMEFQWHNGIELWFSRALARASPLRWVSNTKLL